MKIEPFLISICIPSYNRPKELERLLNSIDSIDSNLIQIVICEDKSPAREDVRKVVELFKSTTKYSIKYIENEFNLGYDKNLKELIQNADGEYVMFMGDDDMFIPEALNKYIVFLKSNSDSGYILRSYRNININNTIEYFRYFKESRRFAAGVETYINLFDKSVFISGFCIKRNYTLEFLTDKLDGSLLFQLYLLAEVCLRYPSAYCEIPLTQAIVGNSIPMFGSSEAEKDLYTPGTITIENSINFIKKYFEVIEYIDQNNNISTLPIIRKNMSKYSYPILEIQRDKGIKEFNIYVKKLRLIGLNDSCYFNIYYFALLFFGSVFCRKMIQVLKKIIGKRPKL